MAPRFSHTDPQYAAALREMGSRLEKLMDARNWSRADLTRAAAKFMPEGGRFGPDNTSNFVNGKRKPTRPFLIAMCRALGVKEEDILPPLLTQGTVQAVPLLTQVPGKKDRYRLVIDREFSLKESLRLVEILEEIDAGRAADITPRANGLRLVDNGGTDDAS